MINTKKMIIHISGPSGSGKTTLGNKLKDKFKNKIIVKDLDNLRSEFIDKNYDTSKNWSFDEIKYQKYIEYFIKNSKKPLVFVGLNNMPWWNKNLYYDMHSQYNYYIKIDDAIVIKQKCMRFLTEDIPSHLDKNTINDMINNNDLFIKQVIKLIKHECNAKEIVKQNNKWNKDYKTQKYKFMSRENIYNEVSKILNKII
jgi:hypothetical protein